jgi:hypothetical protein
MNLKDIISLIMLFAALSSGIFIIYSVLRRQLKRDIEKYFKTHKNEIMGIK